MNEISLQFKHDLLSLLTMVAPSLSWTLSIIIGWIIFPPFTKDEYADVSFNNVVSVDPNDIDNNSSGFS